MASTMDSRLNFRVRGEVERRLRAAASASDQSLTDFVISAAESRADEVLATRTAVPAEYFDQFLAALDAPVERNAALTRAARERQHFTRS